MPVRSLSQQSFFDPEFVMASRLEPGTLPWLLARYRSRLMPRWLLRGWRGESRLGRNAWPASVLLTLHLLRWNEEGMSRLGAVRRARDDLQWRAAMGMACDVKPPDEKTLRDFEKFLGRHHPEAGVPRYLLFHEHWVRLGLDEGLGDHAPLWATDSTPMWCYGAVLDTARLLGEGLQRLGKKWAQATRSSLDAVAEEWELRLLHARSIKGYFRIDWRDPEARAKVFDELGQEALAKAQDVHRRLGQARGNLHKALLRECRRLMTVVAQDLEEDEHGRLVVAHRVSRQRLISLTDPQARHGRKSQSRRFNGFKLHVLGDLISGLIAAVTVTPGDFHDGRPAPRLIRRAQQCVGELTHVLGDTAYGGASLRHEVRHALGVELLAPPTAAPEPKADRFSKADFDIDAETGSVTCPNGITTSDYDLVQASYDTPTRRYKWAREDCEPCPLKDRCLSQTRSRRLTLHPHETELRAHRQLWEQHEVQALYRKRAQCERLVNQLTRHGGRHARGWGLKAANLQAHAIAGASNLKLLARSLASRLSRPPPRAAAA